MSTPHEAEYALNVNPGHLLNLARYQGRLQRADWEIPGWFKGQKFARLNNEELPLCELRLVQTNCTPRPATEVFAAEGDTSSPKSVRGACKDCFKYCRDHPDWATAQGFIIHEKEVSTRAVLTRVLR